MIVNLFQRIGHWISYHTNLGIELPTKEEKNQVDRLSKQFAHAKMNDSKPQIIEDPDMRTKKEEEKKDYATELIESIQPVDYREWFYPHPKGDKEGGRDSHRTSVTSLDFLPHNIGFKFNYSQDFDIEKELNKPEERIKYDL